VDGFLLCHLWMFGVMVGGLLHRGFKFRSICRFTARTVSTSLEAIYLV